MSMLSVNTTITNQYPDSQRCFSSNGSTCENVNPEMMQQHNFAQVAEMAMREWFSTPDPQRRFHMAMSIREWVRRDKLTNIDQAHLPGCLVHLLNIIHDGLKPQPVQLPGAYYAQLYCYLLDILFRLTQYRTTIPYIHLVIQIFVPKENGPNDFRDLICNVIQPENLNDEHMFYCAKQTFFIFENLLQFLNNPKNEKLRADFARNIKYGRLYETLLKYLNPNLNLNLLNPTVLLILRFLISKDTQIKEKMIWNDEQQRDRVPPRSVLIMLQGVVLRCHQQLSFHDPSLAMQNPELKRLIQVITRSFDLLNILMHDSNATDAFVKTDGVKMICTVISYQNSDLARAGFKLLLQVSDAKSLCLINLRETLPFIMARIGDSLERHEEDDVVYSGTGFLSNVVAHKQPVKELAIGNNAIGLLHKTIVKYTPLGDFNDGYKKKLACGIISNSLRALNNFLMMWIPMQNGQRMEMGQIEQQQVCRFIENDFIKRLMACLSIEAFDVAPLLELRSTILRFFMLILRTPSIPKESLLRVTDDFRKKNLVGHICVAFSWAIGQQTNERTQDTKNQLIERVFSLLIRLMEQFEEEQVAHGLYSICCPLSLLKTNQIKPLFILNVLRVSDKILQHCPMLADSWAMYRPTLGMLENHSNPDIEQAVSSLLRKFPMMDTQMDDGLLQSHHITDLG